MSERYDRLFTTLAAPAVERVCSYDDGCALLETYLLQSAEVAVLARPQLIRELLTLAVATERTMRLSPAELLLEFEDQDSTTLRAGAILDLLEHDLPNTLVWIQLGCDFFSAYALRTLISAQVLYSSQPSRRLVAKTFVVIAHQSLEAYRLNLARAIESVLNTEDRHRPEHAQALLFGLGVYLEDYFSVLYRSVEIHYLAEMQKRDPARKPDIPTLKEMVDFAAMHGVPSLETGEHDLDTAFEMSLLRVPMYLTMLGACKTSWGNSPITALLPITALACALDCAPMGRRAFNWYFERADRDARPTDAPLIAELEAMFSL